MPESKDPENTSVAQVVSRHSLKDSLPGCDDLKDFNKASVFQK